MAVLPENPEGLDLEDFVAAHLAARGMFVETGVTERNPRSILELDVVWTDYAAERPKRRPVEVKSGGWGLSDFFKFNGWTHYLGLEGGSFVFRHLGDEVTAPLIQCIAERCGINAIHLKDLAAAGGALAPMGIPEAADAGTVEIWRYSFLLQRRLIMSLGAAIRGGVCPESAKKAKDFFKLVNDAAFFEPDVRTRVEMMFNAHMSHRLLGASAAGETAGLGVNFEQPPETPLFKAALYDGAHFPVQCCLFLGHRGRLAVLKAAVDCVLDKAAGQLPPKVIKVLGVAVDLAESELTRGFRKAVEVLPCYPTFKRYPVFWQTFLWAWGGFILEDRKEQEYAALSAQTGVPMGEIDQALGIFDLLFPYPAGWIVTPANTVRRGLKLMPAALRGLGAHLRLQMYGVKNYDTFGAGGLTSHHMALDNNAAVRLLGADDQLVK